MIDRAQNLRVTLVQMPRWEIATPPFAVALLTGILRGRGFTVFPKDYDIFFYRSVAESDRWAWTGENPVDWGNSRGFGEVLARYDHLFEACVDDILADEPDVVGFSVKVWSLDFSREVAKRLKARRPDLYVIFGGPEMNKGPEHHLVGHPYVDAICRQEGDVSFPSFLETYVANGRRPGDEPGFAYRGEDGEVVDCGTIPAPPKVTDIPFADFSDFDFEEYTEPNLVNLVLSRGCIYRCTFCSEAPAFLKFRSYAAERTLAEIRHVLATTNIRRPIRVHFNDSLLNGDLKALEAFADLLLQEDVEPIEWSGMMALRKQMSDEMVHKIAQAGCRAVFFGMESGSPKIIRLMKKGHTVESTRRLTKTMHEAGIQTTVSIVCGYPGETEKEFYESLDLLKEIAPYVSKVMLHLLNFARGSIMTDKPEKFGVDLSTIVGDECWDWVSEDGTNTPELRLHRLATLQHMLHGKVIDFGGPLDRDAARYDPFRELAQRKAADDENLRAVARNLRVALDESGVEAGEVDIAGLVDDGAVLGLRGWAMQPESRKPARNVVLVDGDGRVLEHSLVDRHRPDIGRRFENPTDVGYGWELIVPTEKLEGAPAPVRLCFYDAESNRAVPLAGNERIRAARPVA